MMIGTSDKGRRGLSVDAGDAISYVLLTVCVLFALASLVLLVWERF